MSDASHTPRGGDRTELWLIAGLIAIVIAVGLYFTSQRQTELRASAVGFNGLQTWLAANDVAAQNFLGGWPFQADRVDLLVIPLFDTGLDQDRVPPTNAEEFLLQQDENDMLSASILQRVEQLPTLVILPKWRSGLRLTEIGHPILLSETARIENVLARLLRVDDAQVARAPRAFTSFPYRGDEVGRADTQLYVAQTFQASGCEPIIGDDRSIVLGDCAVDGGKSRVMVLADPDLLNNHGLRLGDNAAVALDLIQGEVDDGIVLIDYAQSDWFFEAREAVARDRTWSDLLRFFEQPFLTLWIAAGLTLGIFLWRGGVRDRPLTGEGTSAGASKTLAIAARARLMRLSNQDGKLVGAYATARIAATASALLGPANAPAYSTDDAFQRYVARRHPGHADRLRATLETLRGLPSRITAADAARHVEDFETVLEAILNDT